MLDFITPQHMQILLIVACIGAINWALVAYNPQYNLVSMILKDGEQQKYEEHEETAYVLNNIRQDR